MTNKMSSHSDLTSSVAEAMGTVQEMPTYSQSPVTVFLWTIPRSLSTVFTKCVSSVDDVQIWFEPYGCAYESKIARDRSLFVGNYSMVNFCDRYLASHGNGLVINANARNPNWTKETEMTYPWVKSQLESPQGNKKCNFVKDMAYTVGGDVNFMFLPNVKCKHTFLICNPLKVYFSYKRAASLDPDFNDNPGDMNVIEDVDLIKDYPFRPVKFYFHYLHRLWKAVKSSKQFNPVVIDADELTENSEILLRKYFEAVGFPWKKHYVTWDAGRAIIQHWKTSQERMDFTQKTWKIWYQRGLDSSMFISDSKPLPLLSDLTSDLRECVNGAMPYYKEMFESRLKAVDD